MDATHAPFAPAPAPLPRVIGGLSLCLLLSFPVAVGGCSTVSRRYDLDKRVWVEHRLTPADHIRGNLSLIGYSAGRLIESLRPAPRSQEVRP